MTAQFNRSLPKPATNMKVTLLVETLQPGKIAASVLEFPDSRIEADTRESAISQLQANFIERLKRLEAISWNVPVNASDSMGMEFVGVFQDDPDFQAISRDLLAERASEDDSEVDPSYYA
jgi:hypothetical protein